MSRSQLMTAANLCRVAVGSAPASLPWPVMVTIQSTVSFVFLAAIFYITIHFQLNFMFWGIICLNTVFSTQYI